MRFCIAYASPACSDIICANSDETIRLNWNLETYKKYINFNKSNTNIYMWTFSNLSNLYEKHADCRAEWSANFFHRRPHFSSATSYIQSLALFAYIFPAIIHTFFIATRSSLKEQFSHIKKTHLERLEQIMIDLLELGIELDGSHLVNDINHVGNVHQEEAEVPREHVRGAYHVPRPYRVQQVG